MNDEKTGIDTLSDREYEVIRALFLNHGSTKVTAKELGLARATIRNYRTTGIRKMGASGTVEMWAKLGWTRVPPSKRAKENG
jgi:DNA-binding CsgD family transcriptional regulator